MGNAIELRTVPVFELLISDWEEKRRRFRIAATQQERNLAGVVVVGIEDSLYQKACVLHRFVVHTCRKRLG